MFRMQMKVLYPASNKLPQLSDSTLALKIARHSRCSACVTCPGLRPPPGTTVTLDEPEDTDDVDQLLSSTIDGEPSGVYLDACICGHPRSKHGADKGGLGTEEFARRARAAVRLDELLGDAGKLLDFDYTDDDIASLRKQMFIPGSPNTVSPRLKRRSSSPTSSVLSDIPPPPSKRRRISAAFSSDSSSDEEDRPLASRAKPVLANGAASTRASRGAKKAQAQTGPVSLPAPTEEEKVDMVAPAVNGTDTHDGARVKVEDVMDDDQLDRLVTGVTVDASTANITQPPGKPEKLSLSELRRGVIQIMPVENDGSPRNSVLLANLKTLFQKQLPVMPREYITRLVFDPNQKCLAIVKRGLKVVGGICYRPFPHRGFAEIVFFATHSVDQVKGYGGMLMDHFKAHIKTTYPGMLHFLTYADNYAVGYFKKQGFSKEITLDRSVWAGYIKDYEGGTIMQCTMVRKVDYTDTRALVAAQREAVLDKIRQMSRSHVVYEGLPQFRVPDEQFRPLEPKDVPGLRESGWTPEMLAANTRPMPRNPEHAAMRKLLQEMQAHPAGWAFLQPVGPEVEGYYDTITNPMDFQTMDTKLSANQYASMDAFAADAQLVFENCRLFNPETTVYVKHARTMDKWFKAQLANMNRVKKEEP